MMDHWLEIENHGRILSPALLFYPDRIRKNIWEMIRIAGSVDRLRPHVKTYKCSEIVQMQMDAGITRFKCSTLAEAEMLGSCKAPDVLLAYPLTGPNQKEFIKLINRYPQTTFSVLADNIDQIKEWEKIIEKPLQIYIDLDVGMHRSGVNPEQAGKLLEEMNGSLFNIMGFHAYDGHIRDSEITEREKSVARSFKNAEQILQSVKTPKPFITGGSITFPVHAKYPDRELSPGTTLLWDRGYGESFPDLEFKTAATLLTRVVSRPAPNLLCLDLGYKAVACEMKNHSPVYFPQIPDAEIAGHSEEHLVLKTKDAKRWNPGSVLYGFPWHICPTVALHSHAGIVNSRKVTEFWEITSRNRIYKTDLS